MERELDDGDAKALAASLFKPLPPEPMRWARLPATWRAWSFSGLTWFAVGVFFLWFTSGRVSGSATSGLYAWTWVVVAIVVAVWILTSVPGGLVDRRLAARREAARRRDPDKAWLWDHRWDPRGVSGSPLRRFNRTRPHLAGFATLPVIYTLFGMPWDVLRVVWFLWGVAMTWKAWQAWRVWGVGTAHVDFDKFPFHPGERVTLRFGMSEGGAQFERAAFCLRRIEEAPVSLFTVRRSARRYFGLRAHRPPGELPGADRYVTLEFDLPEDVAGTNLSASPPAYWTLDVLANTSAGPYVESFLIPVYERPAA